ncbi:MAG: ImmA/IrrE family metallo-endopeptidase [Clostridia bacterium]|nr:ImmA/IrrE family metallo-endopeptidase [Clostridia bacterium]
METLRLYKIAESERIAVDFADLPHTRAFCIKLGGRKFIAVDKNVRPESNEERVMLAHELGHIKTDSLYSPDIPTLYRKRFEKRADIWAIRKLIPLSSLRKAYKEGLESVHALADHFSVTEDFMQKAIKYYSEKTP